MLALFLPFSSPSSAAQTSGNYTTKSWLERVVVVGLPSAPKTVQITSSKFLPKLAEAVHHSSSSSPSPRYWYPGPSVHVHKLSAVVNHTQTWRQHSARFHNLNQLERILFKFIRVAFFCEATLQIYLDLVFQTSI